MASLAEAIAGFDYARYGPLNAPEGAFECCIETSEGFAAYCADSCRLPASVFELTLPPHLPQALAGWHSRPYQQWIHTVVRVHGLYIDWTARQFDPQSAFPALSRHPFGWQSRTHRRTYLPASFLL